MSHSLHAGGAFHPHYQRPQSVSTFSFQDKGESYEVFLLKFIPKPANAEFNEAPQLRPQAVTSDRDAQKPHRK